MLTGVFNFKTTYLNGITAYNRNLNGISLYKRELKGRIFLYIIT